MAGSTSRLGLIKPSGGEMVDINILNTNAEKIDENIGAFVCTSTTRPTTSYAGMIIYETDTDQMYIRTANGWRRLWLDTEPQPLKRTNPTSFAYYQDSPFSILGGNVDVNIPFDTPHKVPSVGSFDTLTGEWTCGEDGVYLLQAHVAWTANLANNQTAEVALHRWHEGNWVLYIRGSMLTPNITSGNPPISAEVVGITPVTAGQKFKVVLKQSGFNSTGLPNHANTRFGGFRLYG